MFQTQIQMCLYPYPIQELPLKVVKLMAAISYEPQQYIHNYMHIFILTF